MTAEELRTIEARAERASAGPWKAFIEGRDQPLGGGSFLRTGPAGLGPDIELPGATVEDYDFIAHARQDLPRLVADVRRVTLSVSSGEMTRDELDAIQTRCARASQGPWRAGVSERGRHLIETGAQERKFTVSGGSVPDCEFIAGAREDIPGLLEELRRLKFNPS